jgi:hypothetical protein
LLTYPDIFRAFPRTRNPRGRRNSTSGVSLWIRGRFIWRFWEHLKLLPTQKATSSKLP